MTREWPKALPHKPLVEAIVEMRWGQEMQPDPTYPIVVGRLYERVKQEYPQIEDLPVAQVPVELTVHMVRHRFRTSKGGWPLVQIGPGVFTVNDTEGYHWDDFSKRVKDLLPKLYDAFSASETPRVRSVLLRYINAHPIDYPAENLLTFLSKQLGTNLTLPQTVFDRTKVSSSPVGLLIQPIFPMHEPRGTLKLQFGAGRSKNKPALVWEIQIQSTDADIPQMPQGFAGWLDTAHSVAEEWFFQLAKGKLLDSFLKA